MAGKYPESVSEMSIINLFSERTTKTKYIDKNKEVNKNNIKFINSFINEFKDNDNVIWVKAWGFGKDKDYNDTITLVNLPQNTYVIVNTKDGIKRNQHPGNSYWNFLGGIKYAEIRKENE